MTTQAQPAVIDLQPHPRVLSVLGDIPFAPWQCIAELVDNSFDEFLRHPSPGERPRVSITLPGRTSRPADAEVWIKDNGPGLTLDRLQNALRAGWTSNDRHGHLGLFGMGFNIATARMGNITRVRTARAGDPHWTVVTLNLPEMQRAGHFDVPVRTEPKSHPDEHGTDVVVSDLKPALHDQLSRNSRKLRETLGDVYSYLLTEHDFELTVDSTAVQPRRPCIWASERSVVRSGERIFAYIKIDETLGERLACLDCGTWQDALGESECSNCKSERLEPRERRISGWLGIQRYTHKTDFGIDFLRNGRKILLRDKSMFDWVDPNEAVAAGEREYPVEVPYEGRIVGEIHVDHLWVPYQKNGFETGSPDWVKVRRTLRGDSPLRPQKARELGYAPNTSPLAQLFAGYRRTDPGLNYLVPGDGRTALRERAREWADAFQRGELEYQTDQRWYEQAELHDRPTPEPEPEPEPEPDDPFGRAGIDDDGSPDAPQPPNPAPAPPETEDERRARWKVNGAAVPDLQTSFGLRGRGSALQVTGAWRVSGNRGTVGPAERPGQPIYIGTGRGAQVEIFIDDEHPIFTDFAVDVRDLVTVAVADFLRTRENSQDDLGTLFAQLKEQCLSDQRVTGPFLKESADGLLDRIREVMAPIVSGNSTGYWTLLLDQEKASTQQRFVAEGGRNWDDTLADGRWLQYAPAKSLIRLLNGRPDAFLDGRVFAAAYASLTDADAQRAGLERVTDLLSDVAALSDQPVRRRSEELQRGRLSISLLSDELVETA
jgi:hypothetical protein